ncbi:MAG: LptF/LptG family permease [Phycisphaerales bacterium]|nr:LptF/LptG family permease [Phycisphaerales bacterium]
MSLIDRYIARQFLTNVVLLFVILFSFIVVIDVSLNIDQFLEMAKRLGAQAGEQDPGTIRKSVLSILLIADLWWPKLLQLYNFLLGMIMVGAMGFTFSQMSKNREFIALMAAGIGLHRIIKPIIIVALGLTALQAINQEFIIPKIAPLLVRGHEDAGDHRLSVDSVPLTLDGQGRIFRAAAFDANTNTLEGLYILERDENGHTSRSITAESATYHDGGWNLVNGIAQLRSQSSISQELPIDRIESSLDPNELRINRYESYSQALSFAQAREMLNRETLKDPDKRARYERIALGRFSMMISGILTLIIAAPFYATREPKNMVIQSIRCAPIAIITLIAGVIGATAAIPGLPATVGVFIPVMILSVVAVAQFSALKT